MSVHLLNESFDRKFDIMSESVDNEKELGLEDIDDNEELHKDVEDKEVLTEVSEDEKGNTEIAKEEKVTMNKSDLEEEVKEVKRPTTVSTHRNKRNPHKYMEIHNDGYGHRTARQYMQWNKGDEIDLGDTKLVQDHDVKNFTGDGRLHRMNKNWRDEVLDTDYELVENKKRKSVFKRGVVESMRRKRFMAENRNRRARRMRESAERPLDRNDIIAVFQSLARSQGFYGRLLRELGDAKRNDPEEYENFMRHLEKQQFADDVDLIMYIEG